MTEMQFLIVRLSEYRDKNRVCGNTPVTWPNLINAVYLATIDFQEQEDSKKSEEERNLSLNWKPSDL